MTNHTVLSAETMKDSKEPALVSALENMLESEKKTYPKKKK